MNKIEEINQKIEKLKKEKKNLQKKCNHNSSTFKKRDVVSNGYELESLEIHTCDFCEAEIVVSSREL